MNTLNTVIRVGTLLLAWVLLPLAMLTRAWEIASCYVEMVFEEKV
jgi:hypothetical protein